MFPAETPYILLPYESRLVSVCWQVNHKPCSLPPSSQGGPLGYLSTVIRTGAILSHRVHRGSACKHCARHRGPRLKFTLFNSRALEELASQIQISLVSRNLQSHHPHTSLPVTKSLPCSDCEIWAFNKIHFEVGGTLFYYELCLIDLT